MMGLYNYAAMETTLFLYPKTLAKTLLRLSTHAEESFSPAFSFCNPIISTDMKIMKKVV